uniref:hypothetical protein n=1 Tax=uncultured Abyssibacter sp. TaxID=2320202 RepID=UPI0032B2B68B
RLEREFTNDTELAVGTSERYTVYAGFADPSLAEQNLSDDVDVELQETESERAVLSTTDAHLYLTALDDSDGEGIHVRFDPADLEADSPLRIQVEREFDTLTVSPENAELAWDDELQLTAIATESATGVTQDVTRHVSWELDVDDVLTVADTLDDAGLVTPIGDQDGDVQIIATLSAATTETVDTIIQVRVTAE